MALVSILKSDYPLRYLDELHRFFMSQWHDIEAFESPDGRFPEPLVVLDSNLELVGGLAFRMAPSPVNQDQVVWINALFVAPHYRRQGLAAQLINAAEQAAADMGLATLHVYTHIRALYAKCDWEVVYAQGAHTVLCKNL